MHRIVGQHVDQLQDAPLLRPRQRQHHLVDHAATQECEELAHRAEQRHALDQALGQIGLVIDDAEHAQRAFVEAMQQAHEPRAANAAADDHRARRAAPAGPGGHEHPDREPSEGKPAQQEERGGDRPAGGLRHAAADQRDGAGEQHERHNADPQHRGDLLAAAEQQRRAVGAAYRADREHEHHREGRQAGSEARTMHRRHEHAARNGSATHITTSIASAAPTAIAADRGGGAKSGRRNRGMRRPQDRRVQRRADPAHGVVHEVQPLVL